MDQSLTKWVKPFYLKIVGGNFTRLEGRELDTFVSAVNEARLSIDESVIARLLMASGWREEITGSWFAGLLGWNKFANQIGELLLESNRTFSGQGYCFALGRFADDVSANYLIGYLDKYLPQLDCFYDQDWAMAALMWIDDLNGTTHSNKYLASNGSWDRFIANKSEWSLDRMRSHYATMMRFCVENFGATSPPS